MPRRSSNGRLLASNDRFEYRVVRLSGRRYDSYYGKY